MTSRSPWTLAIGACLSAAVVVSSALAANQAELDRLLEAETSPYAHDKEGLIIRHFLGDQREGVFLDVGCFE